MSKLGILAGGGELPLVLIRACREQGRAFHVIALKGHADPANIVDMPHDWVRLGAAAEALDHLRRENVKEVVFAGKVTRPSLSEVMPDWRGILFLARIGGRLLSDNRLLVAIVEELESEGFRVVGPSDVAASLLARHGLYGRLSPTEEESSAIVVGFAAARTIGQCDIGQAAVVQGAAVLDVEGPDGTDALIARCATRQQGGSGAILVKARKPQQEMRSDAPVIGLNTISRAAQARFRGIAVEAGGVLVMNGETIGAAADAAGMFLIGVDVAQ